MHASRGWTDESTGHGDRGRATREDGCKRRDDFSPVALELPPGQPNHLEPRSRKHETTIAIAVELPTPAVIPPRIKLDDDALAQSRGVDFEAGHPVVRQRKWQIRLAADLAEEVL